MRAATLSLSIGLIFALVAIVAPVSAQSSLKEEQKAVLVFDLRMDMLNSSPLGKQMKFAELLSEAQQKTGQGGPDQSKVVRMFGALSAPESLASLQGLEVSEVPFDFFMRAKYEDASSATEALEFSLEESGDKMEKFEKNGKTFYKSLEGGSMPVGMIMHQVDETTIEIGSETYVFQPNRQMFTDNLKAAWSKAPDEAIRLAMDLQGSKALVSELVEEGKKNADPVTEAYLDLVDNISHMGLSIDLTGANLLSVRATALDSGEGEELKSGLDSMLLLAQTGGKQMLPMVEAMAPDMKPVVESILGSLEAKIDGADVSIVIPKPSGFEDAIGAFVESGGVGSFGFGGPPPGGGFGPGDGFRAEGGFGPGDGLDTEGFEAGDGVGTDDVRPAKGSGSRDEGSTTKSAEGSTTKSGEGSTTKDGSTTKPAPLEHYNDE